MSDTPTFTNVFAAAEQDVWKYRFDVELHVTALCGGIPSNPKVIEGWLRTRLQNADVALESTLAETMAERGIDRDAAIEAMLETTNVNGFKQVDGKLVVEGRQVKAAIKEAFNVALGGGHMQARKWGATNKGLMSFVAEHVIVPERYVPILHLDGSQFTEPTSREVRFIHTFRGSSIAYDDVCDPCLLRFTVWSDWDFSDVWPTVWSIGGKEGIGATRSQGFGTYFVSRWDEQAKPRKNLSAVV